MDCRNARLAWVQSKGDFTRFPFGRDTACAGLGRLVESHGPFVGTTSLYWRRSFGLLLTFVPQAMTPSGGRQFWIASFAATPDACRGRGRSRNPLRIPLSPLDHKSAFASRAAASSTESIGLACHSAHVPRSLLCIVPPVYVLFDASTRPDLIIGLALTNASAPRRHEVTVIPYANYAGSTERGVFPVDRFAGCNETFATDTEFLSLRSRSGTRDRISRRLQRTRGMARRNASRCELPKDAFFTGGRHDSRRMLIPKYGELS